MRRFFTLKYAKVSLFVLLIAIPCLTWELLFVECEIDKSYIVFSEQESILGDGQDAHVRGNVRYDRLGIGNATFTGEIVVGNIRDTFPNNSMLNIYPPSSSEKNVVGEVYLDNVRFGKNLMTALDTNGATVTIHKDGVIVVRYITDDILSQISFLPEDG